MSYADIVKKYAPNNITASSPKLSTPLSGTVIPSSALNAPGLSGYSGIVQKYKQSDRKENLIKAEEQAKAAEKPPGFFETAKTYIKAFPGALKQVITAPFKEPAKTAASVGGGILDLGVKMLNSTIFPSMGITGLTKNPEVPMMGTILNERINNDSDLQKSIRTATTQGLAYELGGRVIGGGTVIRRILGNFLGGQVATDAITVQDRAKQAAFDAAFGAATEGVLGGIKRGFLKTKMPIPESERLSQVPSTLPKEQSTIIYKPKPSLGKDPTGEPILAKTEVDSKTGRAIVYYDQSLDTNPSLKTQVFDHEYGHIVDKRINAKGTNISAELPNYKINQPNLDQVLGEFARKQGRKTFQVTAELNAEISNYSGKNPSEKFANAVADYIKNPKAMKTKANTFGAFMEHKLVEPRISENITTAETLKMVPAQEPLPLEGQPVKSAIPREVSLQEPPTGKKLPNIEPKKIVPEETQARIADTEMQISALEEDLNNSPVKALMKYANSAGELPEVIGGKTVLGQKGAISKFGKEGDTIITELGFADEAEAQIALTDYLRSRTELNILRDRIRSAKKESFIDYTPEQLEKINKLAGEAGQQIEGIRGRSSKFFAQTGLKTGKVVEGRPSFNPKSINAPEETAQLFDQLGKENKNFATQRISKGNEDIKDLARLTGLTENDLLKAKPGSIANAETIAAARQLVLDKAQDLMNYLKGVDVSVATTEELKGVKDRIVKLVAMQKAVAGLRTEASNVFRQFGIELMPGENATLSELGRALKERAKELNFDPKSADIFAGGVAKEINLTKGEKIGRGLLSTWYASILSGPKTSVRNILSTSANILTDLASKAANPRSWKEMPSAVSGLFRGLSEGWSEAKAVLKGEAYGGKFMKTGYGATGPEVFTGKWRTYGQVVESVGRFLNAQDKFLSAGAREMEKASLKARGLALEKPLEDALARAYAESTVYHGQPKGRLIGALRDTAQTLRRKFPESKVIVPFVDTVANVLDRQFDYIPFFSYLRLRDSTIMKQVERIAKDFDITSAADKAVIKMRLRDQQIGRAVLGTAVSGAAIALAVAGRVSGTGPTNFNERNQLLETGWRPNSIRIGDIWIPYINLGPLAGIFAMVGNVYDKTHYDQTPTKDLTSLIGKGLIGWTQTQLNSSFLSGVADLMDVLNGNTDPQKYLERLGTGLIPIPATYTQIKDIVDRQQYETRGIVEQIQKKLGLTGGLQPRLNAMGQPVKNDIIYGVSPSGETHDPVYDFLVKNELVVAKPSLGQQYTIPGRREKRSLTPEEYTRYLEEAGGQIYNQLKSRIAGLKNLPAEEKKKQVEALVERERGIIRMKILTKR